MVLTSPCNLTVSKGGANLSDIREGMGLCGQVLFLMKAIPLKVIYSFLWSVWLPVSWESAMQEAMGGQAMKYGI